MNRRLIALVGIVVVLGGLWLVGEGRSGRTGEVKDRREFVYDPLVTNGFEYRRVRYPEEVPEIFALADEPLVVDARISLVSFWPITKEYLADFAKLDEAVDGALEVVGPGGTTVHEPGLFTLWYPEGPYQPGLEVVVGDEAQQVYDAFVEDAVAYLEADREYQRRLVEWQAELEEYMGMVVEGVEPLPEPPGEFTEEPPEVYRSYATEPERAPVVTLPEGSYRIRWRGPDGEIVPGSERRLTVFSRTDAAIGYTVIPEDRWTQPEISFDPAETVYLAEDQKIFLAAFEVSSYNFYRYARLFEPQTIEAIDRDETIWIPELEELIADYSVTVWDDGRSAADLDVLGYRVRQDPGATRGYTIEPFESDGVLEPDFSAVRIPTTVPMSEVSLTGPGGAEVSGSRHSLERVPVVPAWALYAPAVVFLLVAGAIWQRRGRLGGAPREAGGRVPPRRGGRRT